MSYEIKTVYRAVVPGFEWSGHMHQGWYWSRETAERVITNDGGGRQGHISEWDVIQMANGDALLSERPEGKSLGVTVTKINVYGDSDEDLHAAAMERFPDLWRKVLGLPYDEETAAQQSFVFSKRDSPHVRDKLLILDVTAEEARVLGLGDERTRAIEDFQEKGRKREEEIEAEKRAHPLIGRRFMGKVPWKDSVSDLKTDVEYVVERLAEAAPDGETQYTCQVRDFGARLYRVNKEDADRTWRKSEVEAGLERAKAKTG